MPAVKSQVLFIEFLDVKSLFIDVLPFCLANQKRLLLAERIIYVFDASLVSLQIAKRLCAYLKWQLKIVNFDLADIKDNENFSLRLRLAYQDLSVIQDKIRASDVFQNYIRYFKNLEHLCDYLAKDLVAFDFTSFDRHRQILHAITLVNISYWYVKDKRCGIKLFLRKRNWQQILREYASGFDVDIIFVAAFGNFLFDIKKMLREFAWRYIHWGIFVLRNLKFVFQIHTGKQWINNPLTNSKYKLGAEYYGHLNLENKDRFSDLFFYTQSKLKGEDITLLFSLSKDPLDESKWEELQKHHISALARFPQASLLPFTQVPLHYSWSVPKRWHLSDPSLRPQKNSSEIDLLIQKTLKYNEQFSYWKDLFEKSNIRLYTHWYKYDAKHIPLADALKSLNGISTIYQRAFETYPTRELSVVADIVFCYSKNNFVVEKENRSNIAYQLVTGFLGDFRFSHLKAQALEIARPLREKGVKRIIAFLDENTLDDGRWFVGHAFTQRNYAYLIDKVLKDPRYGIIFKPKVLWNLRRRLGDVANQLDELQKSGRGVILGGGSLQNMYPPALAALAADLTIHECLSAGSAGVEAALAGAPTLFLDTEGWKVSPFYQGGLGKVVFQDWPSLWQACEDFFERPDAKFNIGNCTSFLDEIDPFRDGRAAERMGTYLKWLLDGLNDGLSRETVLADAAERYTKLWGNDKVHFKNDRELCLRK